jgi:hypothetical protein
VIWDSEWSTSSGSSSFLVINGYASKMLNLSKGRLKNSASSYEASKVLQSFTRVFIRWTILDAVKYLLNNKYNNFRYTKLY